MDTQRPVITRKDLFHEARVFATEESQHDEASLFGVTDGKAVGTYLEHKFQRHLSARYTIGAGNSALGIDLPGLNTDIKVTSIRQPQSSSPFRFAKQKVFGLGYSLLVFVYDKKEDFIKRTSRLVIQHVVYIDAAHTADYQMTTGLQQIVQNNGNADDIVAYLLDRNLPVDEITAREIAEEVLKHPPMTGYLTISNALQWRLQYGRAIEVAGAV